MAAGRAVAYGKRWRSPGLSDPRRKIHVLHPISGPGVLTVMTDQAARQMPDEISKRHEGLQRHEETLTSHGPQASCTRTGNCRDQAQARINGITIALTCVLGALLAMRQAEAFIVNESRAGGPTAGARQRARRSGGPGTGQRNRTGLRRLNVGAMRDHEAAAPIQGGHPVTATSTRPASQLTTDPAGLHDDHGRPWCRAAAALDRPAGTTQQLSPAWLILAARLCYPMRRPACRVCRIAMLLIRRPARRLRQVLAGNSKLASAAAGRQCGQVRVSAWAVRLRCPARWPVAGAARRAARRRRARRAAEGRARMLAGDRTAAAAWAAEVLADPATVVLDTETTGLAAAFMVEVTVLSGKGRVLLDTLVNPQVPIPAEASAVHSITDDTAAGAPLFAEILPELTRVLAGRRVVIYNKLFDCDILRNELERYFWEAEPEAAPGENGSHPSTIRWMSALRTDCAMVWYSQWFGQWHDRSQSYTWQRLDGGHRARGDCEATLDRLQAMASACSSADASGLSQPRTSPLTGENPGFPGQRQQALHGRARRKRGPGGWVHGGAPG